MVPIWARKLTTLSTAFDAFEERLKFVLSPMNDPYRYVHLSMEHSLLMQTLNHPVGDELEIVRREQPLRHSLEGHQKSVEVGIFV